MYCQVQRKGKVVTVRVDVVRLYFYRSVIQLSVALAF